LIGDEEPLPDPEQRLDRLEDLFLARESKRRTRAIALVALVTICLLAGVGVADLLRSGPPAATQQTRSPQSADSAEILPRVGSEAPVATAPPMTAPSNSLPPGLEDFCESRLEDHFVRGNYIHKLVEVVQLYHMADRIPVSDRTAAARERYDEAMLAIVAERNRRVSFELTCEGTPEFQEAERRLWPQVDASAEELRSYCLEFQPNWDC